MTTEPYVTDAPVFVFGSNVLGIHGAGAAKHARLLHGAKWGVREGPAGESSYALPTCIQPGRPLPLHDVAGAVERFLLHAKDHPDKTFFLTRVGCGFAGFRDSEIAPLFQPPGTTIPDNIVIDPHWVHWLGSPTRKVHTGDCIHD